MASLNQGVIERIPITLPPLRTQQVIANILGTLDDKIELNCRMNETLEGMARALFKSWFIDFDPVRAKSQGRNPSGIDADTAKLFPSKFVASELGQIPNGWSVGSIDSLCVRIAMGPFGSDIKTENFVDTGVPVIRGGNLRDGFRDDDFAFVTEEKADQLSNANAFSGDIVITHRGTLGQVGRIPKGSRFPRYIVSQSQMLLSFSPERRAAPYVFEYLRSPPGQQALLANTSQTGVPAIARPTSSVRAIRLSIPPDAILRIFDQVTDPLSTQKVQLENETRALESIRDTLLPKLLSGELSVPF